MKRIAIAVLILLAAPATARQTLGFLGKTVVLEDSAGAAAANGKGDAYTASLTAFDRAIRLHTEAPTTEKDYLRAAAASMRNWSPADAAELRESFAFLGRQAAALNLALKLPDTIVLCRTSGREEFGAEGYTRGNRIMLNAGGDELTAGLVAHELWHVISRLNPGIRDRAYAVFGFRPCNRIDYKPAFGNQVITNPDCPVIEHYIRATVEGKERDLTLVLYSRSPYVKGGGLQDYAAVSLLELEGDDKHKQPIVHEGRPVVHEPGSSADFYRQASRNTGYMLHVEELTAEHFAALMTGRRLKEPVFLERLGAVLK